jgi:hypothetical protein
MCITASVVVSQRVLDGPDKMNMPVRGDGREAFDVIRRGRIRVGVEADTTEILDNEVQVGMGVNMHCHNGKPRS